MKKALFTIITFIFTVTVSGQIIKKGTYAAYVASKGFGKGGFEVSSGVFVFDATMRMGVSNIY